MSLVHGPSKIIDLILVTLPIKGGKIEIVSHTQSNDARNCVIFSAVGSLNQAKESTSQKWNIDQETMVRSRTDF